MTVCQIDGVEKLTVCQIDGVVKLTVCQIDGVVKLTVCQIDGVVKLTVCQIDGVVKLVHAHLAEQILSRSSEGRATSLSTPSLTHLLVKNSNTMFTSRSEIVTPRVPLPVLFLHIGMQRNATKRKNGTQT